MMMTWPPAMAAIAGYAHGAAVVFPARRRDFDGYLTLTRCDDDGSRHVRFLNFKSVDAHICP
jgi:hypothetical protein